MVIVVGLAVYLGAVPFDGAWIVPGIAVAVVIGFMIEASGEIFRGSKETRRGEAEIWGIYGKSRISTRDLLHIRF